MRLNWILSLGIPFNRPHGIRIHRVEAHAVTTRIPYRRINMNHIRGTHACGLATAAEFCSGLVLLRKLSPTEYRLIMQKLEVEYHYQCKTDALARYALDPAHFEIDLQAPLQRDGVLFYTCEIPVHNSEERLVCTARTTWQIKPWKAVRTPGMGA
jgi:acyl-coenzyme A thioesterase PaaI-like protein